MKSFALKNDICRCNDLSCPLNKECARFIQRGTGRVQTESLRDGKEDCNFFIGKSLKSNKIGVEITSDEDDMKTNDDIFP